MSHFCLVGVCDTATLPLPLEISTQTLRHVGRPVSCNAIRSVETEINGLLCHSLGVVVIHALQSASCYAISLSTHICCLPCNISDLFFHTDDREKKEKQL